MRKLLVVVLVAWSYKVAGQVCPSSPASYLQNTDFKCEGAQEDGPSHCDLSPAKSTGVRTVEDCCAKCAATTGCNAFSFGPLPKFGCRLKSGTGTVTPFEGRLSFSLHNATPKVVVKEIHVVVSNHFDGGCKIRGCQPNQPPGWKDPIWAPNCALTMNGLAQPHAYHVLNRYFTNFFPLAAQLGDQARSINSSYTYMTQPWVVDLFLNCERSNYVADQRYGGKPLLQCPTPEQVATFKRAVSLGDIVWHAAATNQEAGYFPNAGMFEASLELNERLADELGVKASTAVSTRDVPGWTRAAIPLLNKHGINGMSFGSGTPPGRPYGMPDLFVWRDVESGTDVVVTSQSGYGGNEVFLLPNGVGMVAHWTGDNSGPAGVEGALASLRKTYPNASVHCSTFSAFFDEANKPENKDLLPVVTAEMGDAWIYGVPSDPLKNAQFRELARARDECVAAGACNTSAAAMRDFDRLLVKIPEHTWGLAQSFFTADYQNYTNVQFRAALQDSLAAGPLANQTMSQPGAAKWRADYYTTIQAWWEQRSYVTNAIGAIANAAATVEGGSTLTGPASSGLGVPPGWAAELSKRVQALSGVPLPTTATLAAKGFTQLPPSVAAGFQCGQRGIRVGLDTTGALVHLSRNGGASWANATRPIGQFLYQTFNDADYQAFLGPAPAGFGMPQCTPSNVEPICGNFNRPNMTAANPKHVEATPTVSAFWVLNGTNGCAIATQGAMDPALHEDAGAPSTVWTLFNLTVGSGTNGMQLDTEVRMFNKTATRLPESIFVVFRPTVAAVSTGDPGWRLQMFNSSNITLDPTDVMVNGSGSGGAPHTRCVSGVTHRGRRGPGEAAATGSMLLSSADVPCLSTGAASPFPTPRDAPPDMRLGVAYNVFNNIWNTNYVLWYPFDDADKDLKSRFSLLLADDSRLVT